MVYRLASLALCGWMTSNTLAFTPAARIMSGLMSQRAMAMNQRVRTMTFLSSASTDDIAAMRAGEIKKELESFGISTVSFLEKSELVDALVDARAKGMTPNTATTSTTTTPESNSSSSTSTASSSSSATSSTDGKPREERIKEEMEALKSTKAGELKKELQERGISTASFFEKSEFLKALAEARVDGVTKKTGGGSRSGSNGGSSGENYAEYADVEVITDDSAGPRKRQSEAPSDSPAGGSPFGGGAGGMGGMGGMGGIQDILKNMGGMGGGAPASAGAGAGGNPFGGMGGMGGMGDMMGKAQELMKNPKVMELMMKAQSNPKMAAAMQECMSNPAAFAKYQNDPEITEMMNELKQYM